MRGVSELISAVLVLVVTVTIAVIVFSFYTENVKTTTESVTNKSGEAVDCASASITIDNVFVTNGSSGSARAIVRNAGFSDLSLVSAQIFNRTGYNFSASGIPLPGFTKGSIATITFENVSIATCPADFTRLVVTTNCGSVSYTFDGTPSC